MNLEELTMEALEARMAEIETEKAAPEIETEKAEALLEEARAISTEKERRMAAAEQRKAELDAIATEEVKTEIKETFEEERKTMADIEVRNSKEYIDAYAKYIKTGKADECRALLSENGSGKVAVPEFVDDIIRTAWDKDEITRLVKKSYIKGNLKVGFELSADPAVVHTEGDNAPTEEKLVLGITELVPESIKKWITVSDEALDLSSEAFIRYIYDELTYQIAKKAANQIIADIEACGTVSTNAGYSHQCGVPKVAESSLALGSVAKAMAKLSDEAANPVVAINRATWANFKALQYAGSYAIDPFEGLPVVFNNTIKAYDAATTGETFAIVGDFGVGAQMNFPNGEEVNIKVDELSLAEKDLVKFVGREYVGHDVVAPNAFVKLVVAE